MSTAVDPSAAPVVLLAPTAATPVVAPASVPNVGEPNWLPERIAQAKNSAAAEERAKVLAELGVTNSDEAKAAIAAAKVAAEANKTAETRAAELKAKLDGETAKTTAQGAVIAEIATRQLMGLTPEQKKAVLDIAPTDAGAQLRAIAALQPTWTAPAAVVAPAAGTPPAAAPVVTAPNTAPGHTAPPAAAGSPPNHRASYEATQKTNPFAAAAYGLSHPDEVYKPRT